jgi:hypothetical protein
MRLKFVFLKKKADISEETSNMCFFFCGFCFVFIFRKVPKIVVVHWVVGPRLKKVMYGTGRVGPEAMP